MADEVAIRYNRDRGRSSRHRRAMRVRSVLRAWLQPLPNNFVHAEWITLHDNPNFRGFVDYRFRFEDLWLDR